MGRAEGSGYGTETGGWDIETIAITLDILVSDRGRGRIHVAVFQDRRAGYFMTFRNPFLDRIVYAPLNDY